MLVIYNGFNYIALFLISIYFLIAIFLIVAVQQTQLHPNCKFLLAVWGMSYMAQFVCFTAIFMINAITPALPLNKNDPQIRSFLISATTGTQLFCEFLEISIASERIISSVNPARYHILGRNSRWLFSLTILSASAAFLQAWMCQVNLHLSIVVVLVSFELCSLAMNFTAVRYCGKRFKELRRQSTLNAQYQVKESYELAVSMQRAYLVTFIAKNLVNSIVIIGCISVNENHDCVPIFVPLPYVLIQSVYCLGFSTTSAFLLLSLLQNHPRLRLKSIMLLSKIRRVEGKPVEPIDQGFVGDVYFKELKKSWA